jgi:hypothetical protein
MSKHRSISPAEAADRLAISELVEAYAHCADRRDAKGQMPLFTKDTHFVVYMICGEFSDFGTAFYHSAVNDTSLGYGDLIMSPSWRLLGPLETANGTLLSGVSTAMIFAVMLWLIQARFTDLKG